MVTTSHYRPHLPPDGGGMLRWREVRDQAAMDSLVSHTLRKTIASFLGDSDVAIRKISDQLGRSRVSMTQDRYLGAS